MDNRINDLFVSNQLAERLKKNGFNAYCLASCHTENLVWVNPIGSEEYGYSLEVRTLEEKVHDYNAEQFSKHYECNSLPLFQQVKTWFEEQGFWFSECRVGTRDYSINVIHKDGLMEYVTPRVSHVYGVVYEEIFNIILDYLERDTVYEPAKPKET